MAENKVRFTVDGIESERDVRTIADALEDLDGVMGHELDRDSGGAEVLYDQDLISGERVVETVREAGFDLE